MNLNELARNISKIEGRQVELNIAQIKEVLRCLGYVLRNLSNAEVFRVLARLVKD